LRNNDLSDEQRAAGDAHPEKTDEKYCLYNELHNDYGYTPAYVAKLVRECATAAGFERSSGRHPRTK